MLPPPCALPFPLARGMIIHILRGSFDRLGGTPRGEQRRRLHRLRRSPARFRLDPEMRHVSGVTLALECRVEPVFLEARAVRAVAAVRLCLDKAADPGRGIGEQRVAEMLVQRRDGVDRVPDQIQVMNVKDRLREALLLRRGDHQLGRRQPAVAVLTTDLGLVDAPGERPPQRFGQPRHR